MNFYRVRRSLFLRQYSGIPILLLLPESSATRLPQYSVEGLFRWVDYGYISEDYLASLDRKQRREAKLKRAKRYHEVFNESSTLDELERLFNSAV
jgi:hypothetical protein